MALPYNSVSDARPLAASFCSHGREACLITRSKLGPVVDWQQSNAHRPVSALVPVLHLLVDPALR
jgi:hypothetical protein